MFKGGALYNTEATTLLHQLPFGLKHSLVALLLQIFLLALQDPQSDPLASVEDGQVT